MAFGLMRRAVSVGIWTTTCALFSALMGSGSVVAAALVLCALALFIVILIGPHLLASILLVGSPTVFGLPNEFLRPLPFFSMERLLLLVLAGMVFLRITFSPDRRLNLTGIEKCICAFLAWALISLVIHTSETRMARDGWFFIQYAMPMSAFLLSRRIAWRDDGLKRLLLALSVAGVFLAVSGILQTFFGVSVFTMNYQSVAPGHVGRAFGTFSNSHTYTATLFIFLATTLLQYTLYRDALIRFLLVMAIAVMMVGIVLGQSRGPWIGAALAMTILYVRDPRIRPVVTVLVAIAAVVGGAVMLTKIDELGPFLDRVSNIRTVIGRLTTWSTALNMLAHNPLFGVGFGADAFAINRHEYLTAFGPVSAGAGENLGVPHNEYLHVAALLGLTGLGLFLAVLLGLARTLFRLQFREEASPLRRKLALYLAATVTALLFNSFFSDTFVQDYFWLLVFFLAGIVAGPIGEHAVAAGTAARTEPTRAAPLRTS